MNRLIIIYLIIQIPALTFCQPFTNGWIDYSKQYYKVQITEEGIYRIEVNELLNAGIPTGSINPQGIQLFFQGVEQYIYVEGEGNGVFDAGEYIEFYGKGNDGWLDTVLYSNPSWHVNPNYSLYTDTSTYFLTWDNNSMGKRMTVETDTNFTGYTPAPFFFKEERQDYNSTYYIGPYQNEGTVYEAEFDEGEGWFGSAFTSTLSKSISTNNTYNTGPNAEFKIALIGANLQDHGVDISFLSTNYTASYSGIKVNYLSFSEPVQNLSPTTLITFSPTIAPSDRNTIAYISVTYPHTYTMDNSTQTKLAIPDANAQSKSYLEISGFNNQSTSPILYDLSNHKKIPIIETGNILKALITNSGVNKNCLLTSEAEVIAIHDISAVGTNGFFTDYSSIIADSAYLIISNPKLYDDGNGNNWVDAYKNYRASLSGGSFDVIIANINELYDQFSFGIRKHPWAIRSFCDYAINNWPSPPSNLLLLGKSINLVNCRIDTTNYSNNLVPTLGYPASDNLLTAYLEVDTLYLPAIPTGRIAAKNGGEVEMYLNKVQEYDNNGNYYAQTLEGKDWMKQVLHFGGGSLNEQVTFKLYLKNYEQTIEDTSYGGFTHSFYKNSSDPIQITISDSVKGLINNGVSIMTFFGHASGSGFDQNIDYPDSYSNTNGKYPFLLANSCLVGDIHQPVSSTSLSNSEQWVLHPKGVIGFLASVGYGITNLLNFYSAELYKQIGQKSYGLSIGQCIKNTIEEIDGFSTNLKKTCLGMNYHGDPAISINTHSKPDYTITDNDVFFTPSVISTETDSFEINLIVSNIGKAISRDCIIEITRKFPSESNIADAVFNIVMAPAVFYKDTISIKLPTDLQNGMGLNRFNIRLDASQLIDEVSEFNNDLLNVPLLIKAADIIPVYPYQYAIVPEKLITLKAYTGNPFEIARDYKFEIDTNNLFLSPISTVINQTGGVVKWDPASDPGLASLLTNTVDSTVYFWRTRWDSTSIADTNHTWRYSSFQYINGKTGWSQAHFHQFREDRFNLMNYNVINQKFDFINTPKQLQCRSVGNASTGDQELATGYLIDNANQISGSCYGPPALIVAVIDPISLVPWRSNDYGFGQVNAPPSGQCTTGPHNAFVFHTNPQDSAYREGLANMLYSIPDSNYILVYTFKKGNTKQWEDTLYNAFQSLGSTQLADNVTAPPDNFPFAFFIKKGDPSTLQEIIGSNPYDTVNLYANMKTNYDYGYITSTSIGTAANWHSLHWGLSALETHDSVRLEITGIDQTGTETIIGNLSSLPPDSGNVLLNNYIDPSVYPQIKLRAYIKDDSLKTPAQLKRWQVFYDEVPEASLNPSVFHSFIGDTLTEGETIMISTVVENISGLDMDSLLVSTWVIDNARNYIPVSNRRYKPLLKSPDTLLISEEFSTKGIPGINSFWIEANPLDTATGIYDQPEQYHFNNIAELPFYIVGDGKNPLLDVTFDGVHILDGDIVSAKPQIFIQLSDENQYLALDTNSLLQVYLTTPGTTIPALVNYDQNTLRFLPAELPENKAMVEYNPTFVTDGIYELRIQAQDVSKNSSGDIDYTITFEVINKSTITEVFNWPNPFSTSTRFVFTLTGSDIPQDFRIRIMTISGRVVKEIFAHELGPIHVGRNITEYAWDGTDEFGDPLANGIYLYKAEVLLDGNTIEKRETSADKFFHKHYGKMYLLR